MYYEAKTAVNMVEGLSEGFEVHQGSVLSLGTTVMEAAIGIFLGIGERA